MKKQIKRFSPHQNAKVFAIMGAITSLIMIIPMSIMMMTMGPGVDQHGNPVEFPKLMLLVMPVLYLFFGYIMTVIGCAIYNLIVVKLVGGIEFETEERIA